MINQLLNQLACMFAKPDDEEGAKNDYDPKYITRILRRIGHNGKAFFYFKSKSSHVALLANGQINVRGPEGMFRPWGVSEFKDLKPQELFRKLESDIKGIRVLTSGSKGSLSFNSYSDFLEWLNAE